MSIDRLLSVGLISLVLGLSLTAKAAENLQLKEGLSFDQDLDTGFPLTAAHMDDAVLEANRPALVFFGASGDFNTNRQARRVVDIYRRYHSKPLKFIVIDVDHPASADARQLLKRYYRSYIPFELLIDKNGQTAWSQIGEVETKVLEDHLNKLLP